MPEALEHQRWRDLVLTYEDLDAGERAAADDHLRTCAECSALLARVRSIEPRTALQGELPQELFTQELSAADRAAADESLASLERRLAGTGPAPGPPAPRESRGLLQSVKDALAWVGYRRLWPRLLVPVAAAAILAVAFWPRALQHPPGIRGLEIQPYSGTRGGDAGWRTGQSFVLRFELTSAAAPIVFHVGPDGRAALLYPPSSRDRPRRLPPGSHVLPRAEEDAEWRFEGAPGQETFLVVVDADEKIELAALVAEVDASTRNAADRRETVQRLRALLERRVGPVQELEVPHVP